MSSFENLRIVDNFYQTSSFFPMPLTLIGTLDEKGELTSFGAYSLIFPYYIAGKGYYAMVLECRNSSNTAKGILRHGKCSINFLPHSKKNFEEHVRLGFPGDTPEEKPGDANHALWSKAPWRASSLPTPNGNQKMWTALWKSCPYRPKSSLHLCWRTKTL